MTKVYETQDWTVALTIAVGVDVDHHETGGGCTALIGFLRGDGNDLDDPTARELWLNSTEACWDRREAAEAGFGWAVVDPYWSHRYASGVIAAGTTPDDAAKAIADAIKDTDLDGPDETEDEQAEYDRHFDWRDPEEEM